ncbi:MAG TPA: AtpZ/AtpI family protein [Rhizobiaceae bacterium]|nr:AtpZ/AtpI family protein [Rhizobiaceae bacterium]
MDETTNREDADLARRRASLDAALKVRQSQEAATDQGRAGRDATGYGKALRLSSEFIAGIVVGAGLGWGLDKLAGTAPFGLIAFLLLGFGAGVLNVLRTAGLVQSAAEAQKAERSARK